MNVSPLLSIIVPTKDRYETLLPVLRAQLATLVDPRVEIVVQDNSSAPMAAELFAREVADSRVTYRHTAAPLSIVDNTVEAIEASHGEYLIFIGDDDFVSPYVMGFVDWMKRNDCEALSYSAARYWWPTVKFDRETVYHRPGAFWLAGAHDASARRMSARGELGRILDIGGVNYGELPRFYHGIVSRASLERIRARAGTYVPGASPDMAFSAALALVMDHYLYVEYPVSVFGASRNSGGGMTAAGRHYGRLEEQKHLPRETVENWDPLIPRVWSELTIYPQTLREVGRRFGEDLSVDYEAFYASALVMEPHIWEHVRPCLARRYRTLPWRLPRLGLQILKKVAGRLIRAARSAGRGGMDVQLHKFDSIDAVAAFLADEALRPNLASLDALQPSAMAGRHP